MGLANISGTLVGIGLGVIIVSCLSVTIYFSKATQSENEFDDKYKRQLPQYFKTTLYNCSVCIAIFGAFACAAAIGGIVVSILLGGQKIIIAGVGGAACLFTLVCFICEVVFYTNSRKSYIREELYDDYDIYTNNSKVRDYITESLELLYNQAITNFKAFSQLDGKKYYEWSEVKDGVGTSYTKGDDEDEVYYFNYPNLWNEAKNHNYDPVTLQENYTLERSYQEMKKNEEKSYFQFFLANYYHGFSSTSFKMIWAQLGDDETVQIPVAALKFNITDAGSYTRTYRFCWNTSRKAYKCKNIENKDNKYYLEDFTLEGLQYTTGSRFTLSEYFHVKDFYYYYDIEDQTKKEYNYRYYIEDFPIAFHLIDKAAITDGREKLDDGDMVYFEKADKYYKFEPKKYIKDGYKNIKKNAKKTSKYYGLYWCNSEPNDFSDARSVSHNKDLDLDLYKCNMENSFSLSGFYNLKYEFKDDDDTDTESYSPEQPLREAFLNINYGKLPKFSYSELSYSIGQTIFSYPMIDDNYKVVQFVFASFLIQLFAVLVYAGGLASGFLVSDA